MNILKTTLFCGAIITATLFNSCEASDIVPQHNPEDVTYVVVDVAPNNRTVTFVNETKSFVWVKEQYHVQKGDTLKSIAQTFMKKNTYGARELNEFISSIMELNNIGFARAKVNMLPETIEVAYFKKLEK